jgi:cyclic pyranopterin phosphate synthase
MKSKTPPQLIDRHNRHLNYLRVSVTDRCNLRCLYCVPSGRIPKLKHEEILSYEEILRLVRIGVGMGICKVRVTGGEPLVRKGIYPFLERLSAMEALEDVSLTTNGVLLRKNTRRIKSSGIRRINISLDSLKRKRFAQITGYDLFNRVWAGIEKALELGFDPIKINVVALKGINEDELVDFGRLTLTIPIHVRFIEYMPIGSSRFDPHSHLLTDQIKQHLRQLGELIPIKQTNFDGPAQRFHLPGARGEVGFISALSHHFCDRCNRLRLTASGHLRTCLLSDRHVDLKTPLREGKSDTHLAKMILQAARHKQAVHGLCQSSARGVNSQMSAIGG